MSNELTTRQEATLRSYADSFLENTKADMQDISRSFFKIGFRLAEANREEYYKVLGYASIDELAEAEFEIKRSTAYGLMEVWERFHDRENPMCISATYEKFSYTKLLEIAKERYCGSVNHISPDDSVRDIKEFIRFWNKTYDRGFLVDITLKEWKEQEAKRKELEANSKQLEIESESVQTFGQIETELKEEVFEPEQEEENLTSDFEEKIEEVEKFWNNQEYDKEKLESQLREQGIPEKVIEKFVEFAEQEEAENFSVDEEEVEEVQEEVPKKEYDFSRRAGVREFLKDYENWELFTKYTGCCFKDAKQYRFKNGVSILATPIEMFVGREELVKVTDVIYWLFEENWFKAVKITKDQIEAYVVKHRDEL